jgi:hypothetical protein
MKFRYKAKKKEPEKKPRESYMRRIKAFCFECSPSTEDCDAWGCPFYTLRKVNKGGAREWWHYPKHQWRDASEKARKGEELPPIQRKELSELEKEILRARFRKNVLDKQ